MNGSPPHRHKRRKPAVAWLACGLLTVALVHAGGVKLLPPPEFTVAVNDSSNVEVYRGWPLILEADLFPPDSGGAKAKALLIAAPSGPWSNAIQINILNGQGQTNSWPFQLADSPAASISIGAKAKLPKGAPKDPTATTAGQLHWYLTTNDTAQLTAGDYELQGTLTSTNSPNRKAWAGQVQALPVNIHISDEPTLTPALLSLKARQLARLDVLQGNPQQALARINALLSTQTNDLDCLTVKAVLLENAGQTNAAIQAYSDAIGSFNALYLNAEAPHNELSLRLRNLINHQLGVK